jgi:hypothetical protein
MSPEERAKKLHDDLAAALKPWLDLTWQDVFVQEFREAIQAAYEESARIAENFNAAGKPVAEAIRARAKQMEEGR